LVYLEFYTLQPIKRAGVIFIQQSPFLKEGFFTLQLDCPEALWIIINIQVLQKKDVAIIIFD